MTKILFADSEGDDLYPAVKKIWTLQIAEGPDDPVVVYADQPGYPPISEGLRLLKEADYVVFQNGLGYDLFAINKIYPGTLRREQIIDTLVISRFLNAEARSHSLEEIGETIGYRKMKSPDFSEFSPYMAKYAARDVEILQKIWKGVPKKIPSFRKIWEEYRQAIDLEFEVAWIIARQQHHGFRFDYEAALLLEAELRQEKNDLERKLQEIFPPIVTKRYSEKQVDKITGKPKRLKDKIERFNPGSRDQIAKRLIDKYGWEPIDRTPPSKSYPMGKIKVDETILEALPYPEAKDIAYYMRLGKMLGQLADGDNAWLKLAVQHDDGEWYIHGAVNTIGCRTHRMSHFKPNMAQVDKDHRMRALFLPDKGHKLIGVDADGLELRELAHFLAPLDGGRYVKIVHEGKKEDGTDIHTQNRKSAGLYLRDSAKTMIYAHNYGCGDKKLGIIVTEDAKEAGKPVPKGSLSKIGKDLRQTLATGIKGLGQANPPSGLIGKCKKQHDNHGFLRGHDGRKIQSASAHSALNTLLQGNGSIVMKQALVVFDRWLHEAGLQDKVFYCANVHDEFQLSVPNELVEDTGEVNKKGLPVYRSIVAEKGMEAITKAGEILNLRCPLVGSADIGENWAETH